MRKNDTLMHVIVGVEVLPIKHFTVMRWTYPETLVDTHSILWRTCQYKTCRQQEAPIMWLRRQEDLRNSHRRQALYRVAGVVEADVTDVYHRRSTLRPDRQ